MDIKNTFQVAKEIGELATKYDKMMLDCLDIQVKKIYYEFVHELDKIHSQLLQLSTFAADETLDKNAITITGNENLPSRSKITVIYEYPEEGLALVEDTGADIHLIPIETIEYI